MGRDLGRFRSGGPELRLQRIIRDLISIQPQPKPLGGAVDLSAGEGPGPIRASKRVKVRR